VSKALCPVTVAAFLWGLAGVGITILLSPIRDSILATLIAYLTPLALGAVAGYFARSVAGLVAVILGMATAIVLGVVLRRFFIAMDGEFTSRVTWWTVVAALTSFAYAGTSTIRSLRARRVQARQLSNL